VTAHHSPQGQERKKSQDNSQRVHKANANIAPKRLNNCVCVPRACRQHLQTCQAGRSGPALPSLQLLQLRKPRRKQSRINRPSIIWAGHHHVRRDNWRQQECVNFSFVVSSCSVWIRSDFVVAYCVVRAIPREVTKGQLVYIFGRCDIFFPH